MRGWHAKVLGRRRVCATRGTCRWTTCRGLVVDVKITEVTGPSERDAALDMLKMVPGNGRITVGSDRGYDTKDSVWDCRDMHITPHVPREGTRQ